MKRGVAALLVCLLATASAQAGASQRGFAQPGGDGQLFVYLQPLPTDAGRFEFTIASLAAVTEGDVQLPLALSLTSVTRAEARHQRLLATGQIPATAYTALSLTVSKASLRREGGRPAALVVEAPVRLDASFVVPRGKALVLWLTFRPEHSLRDDGITFRPVLSAQLAPRPIQSLAGFVSNTGSDTVTVFDKRLGLVSAVIPTGRGPAGMALDRERGRLYVACEGDDEILSIDVASAEIVERTRLLPGDGPREMALARDGQTLVSVNAGSNSVSLFDTAPLTRIERLAVGSGPSSILIEPDGRRAFVFNTLGASISVVDLPQRSVVATLAMDAAPLRGQFGPRGDRILVLHERSPYLSVVDPTRLVVVSRARLRIGIDAIEVDTRRNVVYIGGRDDSLLEFYDPNTLLPVNSMPTGGGLSHLVVDAENSSLFVVSPVRGRVLIVSPAERRVTSEIDAGKAPYWVAVMGER